jgi:hypothetical protein
MTVSTYQKVESISTRLNQDAYRLQMSGRKTPLKQFNPCPKSLQLLEDRRNGVHFGTSLMLAAMTPCPCHSGASQDDLFEMCQPPAPAG